MGGMASRITKEDKETVSKFIFALNNLLEEHRVKPVTEIYECDNGDIEGKIHLKFRGWQFDITDEINKDYIKGSI